MTSLPMTRSFPDRLRGLAALALLAASATACRTAPDAPPAPADTAAATPAPDPNAAPNATATLDSAAAPRVVLALDPEGLRLVDAATGRTRPVPFGTPRAAALDALGPALGAPRTTGTLPECGAGPLDFAAWPTGLTAWFQNEAFAGWSTGADADTTLTTMAGVGIGSRRAAVESALAVTVEETTLGTEFTAGALSGVFSDATPGARVEALWAGVSCVFR